MKFPPFGNILYNSKILLYEIYLFIGSKAWEKSSSFQNQRPGTLCIPPYLSAFNYKWPIKDIEILIFDTGWCPDDYIKETVACMYSHKAKKVRVITTDNEFIVFNKGI